MSKEAVKKLFKICSQYQQWTVIDLSMPICPGMPVYPGDPEPVIDGPYSVLPESAPPEFCYLLRLSTQTGTHIQAPHYFLREGRRITDYHISSFIMTAFIVDLSSGNFGAMERIVDLAKEHDLEGCAIVFKTVRYESGADKDSPLMKDHPHISLELAQLLTRQSIAAVGIDTLGFEPAGSTKFEVNRLFCGKGILILEGLCNLSTIPAEVFVLQAFPLRIMNVEGTPCRAVAFIPPLA